MNGWQEGSSLAILFVLIIKDDFHKGNDNIVNRKRYRRCTMAKKMISFITMQIVIVIVLSLCAILFLNISTMAATKKIENGNQVKAGFGNAIVKSGSMEPAISKNDLIIIKASESYDIGDIATYVSENGSLITHRIIEVSGSGLILQGDANNTVDKEIHQQRLLGKVIHVIPDLGGIISVFSSPIGIAFIVVIPTGIILIANLLRRADGE